MANERRYNRKIERLRFPERIERMELERVLDLCLNGGDVSAVLDVGTGSGLFAEAFWKRGLTVAGIDVNPEMIEAAKKYVPEGDFRLAPMEQIPFPDNSFDLVFMGHVLHEADDFDQALGEAKRCARKRVCALEWPYREEEAGPPLDHRLKSEDVLKMAEKAGFSKVEAIQLKHMILYRFEIG